jgi:chromosome segregation ATPase
VKEKLDIEIAALEEYCEELSDAIDDFEHEARRCRDKLERVGGLSHDLARELKRLEENRNLNRREMEKARHRIAELKQTQSG